MRYSRRLVDSRVKTIKQQKKEVLKCIFEPRLIRK